MGAANILVKKLLATIESDETPHLVTFAGNQRGGGVLNSGEKSVFIRLDIETFQADGLQADGEIELASGGNLVLPNNANFFRHRCAAGETSTIMYSAGVV